MFPSSTMTVFSKFKNGRRFPGGLNWMSADGLGLLPITGDVAGASVSGPVHLQTIFFFTHRVHGFCSEHLRWSLEQAWQAWDTRGPGEWPFVSRLRFPSGS